MITDLILHNHPRMKTITLNDNHIAHLNAKNTTKLEYLNLSNNNLLPTNDIDQLISSKHLWHVLVNGINGNDSNLLIVFYVQIMPDDFVMQLHR
ncbi:hypothetical protein P9478_21325, partial [Escherichia coli]